MQGAKRIISMIIYKLRNNKTYLDSRDTALGAWTKEAVKEVGDRVREVVVFSVA